MKLDGVIMYPCLVFSLEVNGLNWPLQLASYWNHIAHSSTAGLGEPAYFNVETTKSAGVDGLASLPEILETCKLTVSFCGISSLVI